MHEIYELKEMLCEELKEYGEKGSLDVGSLDIVDKLAHAIKNLDKIIEAYEEDGYSSYDGTSYDDGSYARRGDYSRANRGRGSNARRDSMGRYSRARRRYSMDADMIAELRELMDDAKDERTRQEFQKFISKIEGM